MSSPPATISEYSAEYKEDSRYPLRGIHHTVKDKNTSSRKVAAVSSGFVSLDVWNESIDRIRGASLEKTKPGDSEKNTGIARTYLAFSFLAGFVKSRISRAGSVA